MSDTSPEALALARELADRAIALKLDRFAAERAALGWRESDIRYAWEMGFKLCRSYADNHTHFAGEQRERQWERARATLVNCRRIEQKIDDVASGKNASP